MRERCIEGSPARYQRKLLPLIVGGRLRSLNQWKVVGGAGRGAERNWEGEM